MTILPKPQLRYFVIACGPKLLSKAVASAKEASNETMKFYVFLDESIDDTRWLMSGPLDRQPYPGRKIFRAY